MFSKNLWFLVGLELLIANDHKPEKTADILWCQCRFPPKMSPPRSGKCHITVRHQYEMSALISQTSLGNQWWHHEISAVFWGYIFISFVLSLLFYITCYLQNQERNDLKPSHLRTLTSDFLWWFTFLENQINWHPCFFLRAAEDVELWFSEVENLLAVEDLGKVCYRLSLEPTHG